MFPLGSIPDLVFSGSGLDSSPATPCTAHPGRQGVSRGLRSSRERRFTVKKITVSKTGSVKLTAMCTGGYHIFHF
jgi:hypothetical protein